MPGSEFIGIEELNAIKEIFTNNKGILYRYGTKDSRVASFEKAFTEKFKVKYAHAVSSGTAALKLSLQALGVKPGDEVITQAHTFIATVEAIVEVGAIPVIANIDKSLNMDPESLQQEITSKTRAVIPVHMSGVACDMKRIKKVIEQCGTDVKILEDNAQMPGGTFKGQYTGTIGDVGIFSLDFGKVITTGEGGIITTNDEKIYNIVRGFSDHGHAFNLNVPRGLDECIGIGFNYKMGEIQGALGLVQLRRLFDVIKLQQANKKELLLGIKDLGLDLRQISDPSGDIGDSIAFFLPTKEETTEFVKEWQKLGLPLKNIPTAMKWHFAGYWNHIHFMSNGLKSSWDLLERTVEIPVRAKMSQEEKDLIIENILKLI